MDARAYLVSVLFGFVGGVLVPGSGPDRKAVQVTLVLMIVLGLLAWVLSEDPFAGPSLTVGGITALLGTMVRRQGPGEDATITARSQDDRGG